MNKPSKILWAKIIPDADISRLIDKRDLRIARTYKRIIAYVIDAALVGLCAYYIMVTKKFGYYGFEDRTMRDLWIDTFFFFFLLMIGYNLLSISVSQKTLGTSIMRIGLLSIDGERINCLQAAGRGTILGLMTTGFFPYVLILHSIYMLIHFRFDSLHRTFWDMASQTVVVEKCPRLMRKR